MRPFFLILLALGAGAALGTDAMNLLAILAAPLAGWLLGLMAMRWPGSRGRIWSWSASHQADRTQRQTGGVVARNRPSHDNDQFRQAASEAPAQSSKPGLSRALRTPLINAEASVKRPAILAPTVNWDQLRQAVAGAFAAAPNLPFFAPCSSSRW
jgi:hypothetical protein